MANASERTSDWLSERHAAGRPAVPVKPKFKILGLLGA